MILHAIKQMETTTVLLLVTALKISLAITLWKIRLANRGANRATWKWHVFRVITVELLRMPSIHCYRLLKNKKKFNCNFYLKKKFKLKQLSTFKYTIKTFIVINSFQYTMLHFHNFFARFRTQQSRKRGIIFLIKSLPAFETGRLWAFFFPLLWTIRNRRYWRKKRRNTHKCTCHRFNSYPFWLALKTVSFHLM